MLAFTVLMLPALAGVQPVPPSPVLDPGLGVESPAQDVSADAYSLGGVQGNAVAVRMILRDVQALDAAHRAEAAEALRVLTATCPYSRASVQLPLVLHAVLQGLPADVASGDRDDWESLRDGVATHAALVRALGVEAPALTEASDPVAAIRPLIDGIPGLVRRIDQAGYARIDASAARFEAITGHRTVLWTQLVGWRHALEALAPSIRDPGARARVDALIDAIATWDASGC